MVTPLFWVDTKYQNPTIIKCVINSYIFNTLFGHVLQFNNTICERLGLFHALFQGGREICAISRPPIPRTIFKNSRDREGGKSLLFHALPRKYGKKVYVGGREMWAISRPPVPRNIFKNSRDREGGKSLLFHALPEK